MNKDNRKKESRSIYTRLLIVLVLIALLVPAVFTAVKMGVFSGEPQIETPVTTTDPDAPTLRFATDYDFCPNAYINEKGELVGLYIEAATELANRLGMKPEFKIGEWLKCREMMEKGDVDVLLGLEIFSNMEGTLRTIPLGADDLRVYGRDAIDSAAALAGKRVLVVHPFKTTIERQYAHRAELFPGTDILPQFADLRIVQAVQGLAGADTGYASWFDALAAMEQQMDAAPYDVAIIGAGAYGLPLAAHARDTGHAAIQMSGALQLLFGIRGKRWDDHPIISKLYNDAWVRPEETLAHKEKVEGGSYW